MELVKFDAILADVAAGVPVRKAVGEHGVSSRTFYAALQSPELEKRYAHAREAQLDALADEIIEISDESPPAIIKAEDNDGRALIASMDSGFVAWQRNRIDSRKWLLAKLAPKKYGDADRTMKVDISHSLTGLGARELLQARDTLRNLLADCDRREGSGEPAVIDVSPLPAPE